MSAGHSYHAEPTELRINNAQAYDVAIVGGGLVGSALALALKNTGIKTVLFEQKHELPFSQDTLNNSRAIALSCTSVQILKTLGLWAGLGEQSTPLVSVHVSEHQSWGRIQFESKP